MTAIVGFSERGRVWIGGDSAAIAVDYNRITRADPKVFRLRGGFIVGYTTSFRLGQLLRFKTDPPPHPEGMPAFEYLCSYWIDAARNALKCGGFDRGGNFLIGYRGMLFQVYEDFSVGEPLDGLAACGSGEKYALGAMHAARGTPRERILTALKAAARFSAGVVPPFRVLSG